MRLDWWKLGWLQSDAAWLGRARMVAKMVGLCLVGGGNLKSH